MDNECSCGKNETAVAVSRESGTAEDNATRCDELYREYRDLKRAWESIRNRCKKHPAVCLEDPALLEIERMIYEVEQQMRELHCELPAAPPPAKVLRIDRVEVTQSIQFLNYSMGDTRQGTGFAEDNSIPLIAHKQTVVRVYPWSYQDRTRTLTGQIAWRKIVRGETVATGWIDAANRVTTRAWDQVDRGAASHTVNFIVPASLCTAELVMEVEIWNADAPSNAVRDKVSQRVQFERVGELRVRGVLIHYTGKDAAGNDTDIAAPTNGDLFRTLGWMERMLPIERFHVVGTQVEKTAIDFTQPNSKGWIELNGKLAEMSFASTTSEIYIGLLPSGVPTGTTGGYGGMSWRNDQTARTALFYQGDGWSGAHEIGHSMGRGHVRCSGSEGNPDLSYPNYPTGAAGTIGEFGFDSTDMTAMSAANFRDIMTYCTPKWISPYTYTGILAEMRRLPAYAVQTVSERRESGVRTSRREMALLRLRLERGGRVQLVSCVRLTKDSPVQLHSDEEETPFHCELLGAGRQLLAKAPLQLNSRELTRKHPPLEFCSTIEWDRRAGAIVVVKDGEEIAEFAVPADDVDVSIQPLVVRNEERGDRVTLQWMATTPTERTNSWPHYLVRYSNDNGETWIGIAAGLRAVELDVDLESLPGGEQCVFEVIVSDELRSASARSEVFSRPRRRRRVFILRPASGEVFRQGEPVALQAIVFSPDFGSEDGVWRSQIDGTLGTGSMLTVTNLRPGRHHITYTVFDGMDQPASAGVWILVEDV